MIKLADTLVPMADFPAVEAKDVEFSDNKTLQEKYDNGELSGSGISITVDTDMSSTSTNPVQNKVIKEYVDNKSTNISAEDGNAIVNKSDGIYVEDLSKELDKLNIAQKTVNEVGSKSLLDSPASFTVNLATTIGNAVDTQVNKSITLKESITNYDYIDIYIRPNNSNNSFKRMPQVTRLKVSNITFNDSITPNDSNGSFMLLPFNADSTDSKAFGGKHFVIRGWFKTNNTFYIYIFSNPTVESNFSTWEIVDIIGIKDKTIIVDPVEYVNTNNGIEDTPVGTIIKVISNNKTPKHYVVCDGSEYNISYYPYLAQHFADNLGSINYFGGDGINTFAVPKINDFSMSSELFDNIDKTYISSKPYQSFTAEKAFDNNITTYFHTYNTSPIYLGFITSNPVSFDQYSITNRHNSYETRSIENFELQATEDGIQWETIDVQTNLVWTGNSETKTFDLNLDKSYIGYRIYTEENVEISIAELKFLSKPIITELYCIKYEPTYYMKVEGKDVYSTAETMVGYWIDGKPLYQKTINFGSLPNATEKSVAHKVSNVDNIWVHESYMKFPDNIYIKGPNVYPDNMASIIKFYIHGNYIICVTGADRTNATAYITIRYTKITD